MTIIIIKNWYCSKLSNKFFENVAQRRNRWVSYISRYYQRREHCYHYRFIFKIGTSIHKMGIKKVNSSTCNLYCKSTYCKCTQKFKIDPRFITQEPNFYKKSNGKFRSKCFDRFFKSWFKMFRSGLLVEIFRE